MRLERIRSNLTEALRQYITGKNSEKRLVSAVDDCVTSIKSSLKLPKAPEKGVVVMTEAASSKNNAGKFTKGPSAL